MDIKLVDRREANRRYLNVVWRWLLVVGGAASAGWIIFNALHSARQSAIALATTGVAVATAIAFFSDIMGLLHGCRAYLDGLTDSLQSLTSGFWKSWGSLTAIVVALYAFEADRHELPAGTPDPWYVVYSNRPAPDDGPRLATISALYAKSAVHNARNQWTTGVSFTQTEIDVSLKGLRRIMEALKACGSVPNEPAVELKIEGFASSKEFGDPKTPDEKKQSDEFNVDAANHRAWAAYCFAKDAIGAQLLNTRDWPESKWACGASSATTTTPGLTDRNPVSITVHHWRNDGEGFAQMMTARMFIDRPPGLPEDQGRAPEELDRRVDFEIVKAGACERPAIPIPQSAAANTAAGA
jgi:hypothetical protein